MNCPKWEKGVKRGKTKGIMESFRRILKKETGKGQFRPSFFILFDIDFPMGMDYDMPTTKVVL